MRRVVVTGIGLVTPLAVGKSASWRRLIAGESGLTAVRGFDASGIPCRVAAEVPRVDEAELALQRELAPEELYDAAKVIGTSAEEARKTPNFIGYALAASEQALTDADWAPSSREDKEEAGVSIGVGMSSLPDVIQAAKLIGDSPTGYRRVSPYFVPRILPNLASGHVSIRFELQGPNLCSATACAAGAHATGDAFRAIQSGDASVMLAGGTESCIHEVAFVGFNRARALATSFNDRPREASRPFDRHREGFVIGEGAGVMVLEEHEHAVARGARIYAEIIGYGTSGDAHHITVPPSDGSGALRAIRRALRNGRVRPDQVDYVNAHATSTPLGDSAESRALEALFGDRALVSSTKGATGHLLGAAGAVEAAFTVLSIYHDRAPPTLNLHEVDDGSQLRHVAHESVQNEISIAASNSFGFGGTNASLVFSKYARTAR